MSTPEHYPLSLNALSNACNQKSNRDPVVNYAEAKVQSILDRLKKKHLVSEASSYGGRVAKYVHRFANTEFSELKLSNQELGILCELFLRGPQTPGELRSRTARLCKFNDVSEVESCLATLEGREDGPFVVKLPREPGKRESRFAHLFAGTVSVEQESAVIESVEKVDNSLSSRVVSLERSLAQALTRIDDLERRLDED